MSGGGWDGRWVSERVGVEVIDDGNRPAVTDLVGLALRHNPRRAHLLVSHVLGKHVPSRPEAVLGCGYELAARVRTVLDVPAGLVLGYAETATGLGHAVAEALGAPYLHSTRRVVDGVAAAGGFAEDHSHATEHLLLPADPAMLIDPAPVVLIDDELSTGATALNTIRALDALCHRDRYVVAALVDVRDESAERAVAGAAAELGTSIEMVAPAHGAVHLPADVVRRAEQALDGAGADPAPLLYPRSPVITVYPQWPYGLPVSGRHGWTPADSDRARAACEQLAVPVEDLLTGGRVLVLGTEELMYVPTLLAESLAGAGGRDVLVSSTTRSPVAVVDDPGYAVRNALQFPSHDRPADGIGWRFAYNVLDAGFTDVVVVLDRAADTGLLRIPGGLLFQLAGHVDRVVAVVVGP